jgi:P2 family phage contractile tail tube protein
MATGYEGVRAQLVNYEIFDGDGTRLLGTSTIDLPELNSLTAEIAGAGIAGKIDMPTVGMLESLTVTLNWRSINPDFVDFSVQRAVDLLCYGAAELYDHAEGELNVEQIKISIRGIPKKGTLGKFEPATTTDTKNEIEVIYMKIEVAGEEIIEFDKVNYTFVVNGIDYLADTREALNVGDLEPITIG